MALRSQLWLELENRARIVDSAVIAVTGESLKHREPAGRIQLEHDATALVTVEQVAAMTRAAIQVAGRISDHAGEPGHRAVGALRL